MPIPDYKVYIGSSIIEKSFNNALIQNGNFYNNLRAAFTHELGLSFEKQGVPISANKVLPHVRLDKNAYFFEKSPVTIHTGHKLNKEVVIDANFCSQYGHGDYSLTALNYIHRPFPTLPSLLPFGTIEHYFLGNIALLVENKDYTITLQVEEGLNITGYTFDVSSKKRKSYICLLGIYFNQDIMLPIYNKYASQCSHPQNSLDNIRINNSFFPVTFICRQCGKILTCSCFEDYISINNGLTVKEDMLVKKNICHLCTGNIPSVTYPCSPTPSTFLLRYMPYHHLLSLKKYGDFVFSDSPKYKDVENEVRELFGYPKVGEQWVSETILYKIVQSIFPSLEVIHHYRGAELHGLELDIWVPTLKLAIEYQGIQHYKVIKHWGGKDGLNKRQENDRKKKNLCKELGYKLVEFLHDEFLTTDLVTKRLVSFGIQCNKKLSKNQLHNHANSANLDKRT